MSDQLRVSEAAVEALFEGMPGRATWDEVSPERQETWRNALRYALPKIQADLLDQLVGGDAEVEFEEALDKAYAPIEVSDTDAAIIFATYKSFVSDRVGLGAGETVEEGLRCGSCGKRPYSTLTDQCPHCGASAYGQTDRFAALTDAERGHVLDALHFAAENGSKIKAALYDRLTAEAPASAGEGS